MSPLDDPGQHLRILAQIAGHVDREDFMEAWLSASNHQELKEAILRDDRLLTLTLKPGTPSATLIGQALKDILLPEGTLIALVRRGPEVVIPRGSVTAAATMMACQPQKWVVENESGGGVGWGMPYC